MEPGVREEQLWLSPKWVAPGLRKHHMKQLLIRGGVALPSGWEAPEERALGPGWDRTDKYYEGQQTDSDDSNAPHNPPAKGATSAKRETGAKQRKTNIRGGRRPFQGRAQRSDLPARNDDQQSHWTDLPHDFVPKLKKGSAYFLLADVMKQVNAWVVAWQSNKSPSLSFDEWIDMLPGCVALDVDSSGGMIPDTRTMQDVMFYYKFEVTQEIDKVILAYSE